MMFGNSSRSAGPLQFEDLDASFSEYLGASFDEGLRYGTSTLYRPLELLYYKNTSNPTGEVLGPDAAAAEVKSRGLSEFLPNLPKKRLPRIAFDLMLDRAQQRAEREFSLRRHQGGLASGIAGIGAQFAAGLIDPVNVALAFVPVVGEARYATALARATGMGGRAATRFAVGAVEGAAGAALLEPFAAGAALYEGQDYDMLDSFSNVVFGGVFGGGLHATSGLLRDAIRKGPRKLSEPVTSRWEMIDQAPYEVRMAGIRSALADLMEDRPARSAQVIEALRATRDDVRAALSPVPEVMRIRPQPLDRPSLEMRSLKNEAAAARSEEIAARFRADADLREFQMRLNHWQDQIELAKSKAPKPAQNMLSYIRAIDGIIDRDGALKKALGDVNIPRGVLKNRVTIRTKGLDKDLMAREMTRLGYIERAEDFPQALRRALNGETVLPNDVRQLQDRAAVARETLAQKRSELNIPPNAKSGTIARMIAEAERVDSRVEVERLNTAEADLRHESETPYQDPEIATVRQEADATEYRTEPTQEEKDVADTLAAAEEQYKSIKEALPERDTADVDRELATINEEQKNFEDAYKEGARCLFAPATGPATPPDETPPPAPKASATVEPIRQAPAPEAPKLAETAAVKPTSKLPQPKEYSQAEIARAVKAKLDSLGGKPIGYKYIQDTVLPGVSKNKLNRAVDALMGADKNLHRSTVSGDQVLRYVAKTEKAKTAKTNREKDLERRMVTMFDKARQNFEDAGFPGIAQSGRYDLEDFMQVASYNELGIQNVAPTLNRLATEGKVKITNAAGQKVKSIKLTDFDFDSVDTPYSGPTLYVEKVK